MKYIKRFIFNYMLKNFKFESLIELNLHLCLCILADAFIWNYLQWSNMSIIYDFTFNIPDTHLQS